MGAWVWCQECSEFYKLQTARPGELERMLVFLEGSSKKFANEPVSTLVRLVTTGVSVSSTVATTSVALTKGSAIVTAGNA